MAKNDLHVIMYKILKYLYECMKNAKTAELEDFSWDSKLCHIPKAYWCEIIAILVKHGYIVGFDIIECTKDNPEIITNRPFKITLKGIQCLEENSMMEKAREFCGETFNVILSAILNVVI